MLKYKFILPVLLVFLFASCRKGGEPVPYGSGVLSDDGVEVSARVGDDDGDHEDGVVDGSNSSDNDTGVVGGDDNEDDDGIDIVGGDDNEDDDITVTVIDEGVPNLPVDGGNPASSQYGD